VGSKRGDGRFARHRGRWGALGVGVILIGVGLGLGLSITLDESPSHASGGAAQNPQLSKDGPGPGTAVSDHPGPSSVGASAKGGGFGPNGTGLCQVPVRNTYDRHQWREQAKCAYGGGDRWLVTIRNSSGLPVFVNEWYGAGWHGQTTIPAQQSATMPMWNGISPQLWVGTCWPRADQPGTCQAGAPDRYADVYIERWQNANDVRELWIRGDQFHPPASISFPMTGAVVAINNSAFPVELNWRALGTNERGEHKYVTIPPKGHSQPIPSDRGDVTVFGKKDLGNGEVSRVTFAPTGGQPVELYRLTTPGENTGIPPYAEMTWLNGSWCSVHLENIGPELVILHTWYVPPYINSSGKDLWLRVGQSGTLDIKKGTVLITGHVGTANTGDFTTLKATAWKQCP